MLAKQANPEKKGVRQNKEECQRIPSTFGGLMECLLIHIAAFPQRRQTSSPWKGWIVESNGEVPSLLPYKCPLLLIVSDYFILQVSQGQGE